MASKNNMPRRRFIQAAGTGIAGSAFVLPSCAERETAASPGFEVLDRVLAEPVLKKELFPDPLIVESLELLRFGENFICRVRTANGAEGISVSNNAQMMSLWPIFLNRLQPFFKGKDLRDLEALLEEVYVYKSNYKLQNLALWVPLATIEFAVLDLMGKVAGLPMGELIGETRQQLISVYRANNFRGKSAEESLELMVKQVEETKARAMKFKVGGRMSKNLDDPPGRSEELIPLVRRTFGDEMVIYADSNGSYDVREAVRIGKLMEEYHYDFYEEPVPFDWYAETLEVARSLEVPVAGGEQEPSMRNFRWLIAHDALDIVQPDIFYFGGMIRSMKVARMAHALGKSCVPHISGSGLGYLYMMHFVSVLPNAGPYHEFKGFNRDIPLDCPTSSLESVEGRIRVPSGPGLGVDIDPAYLQKHRVLES